MMKTSNSILGVCRSCQSVHPVHFNRDLDPNPDPDSPQNVDEPTSLYVINPHLNGPGFCCGSGTEPQALVRE